MLTSVVECVCEIGGFCLTIYLVFLGPVQMIQRSTKVLIYIIQIYLRGLTMVVNIHVEADKIYMKAN